MKMAVKSLSIAVLTAMLVFAFAGGCKEIEDTPEPPPSPVVATPGDTVINIATIQGVTVPATDGTPVTAITENDQYSGTVAWNDSPVTFATSTVYTATITLTPKNGYTLQGVAADFFTVDGATSVSNAVNSGIITAEFPSTDATVINIAAIHGIIAPVNGGIPVNLITENEQYSGTITWNGNPYTFAASTVYTATITLTPKNGYTLQGVAADFFTVEGATSVINTANSGVITAEFPSTDATVINIAVIQGVTAPVNGGTPVRTITENGQYSGTITWSPTISATFASATLYTAIITLTPKFGYTLAGVTADFFTVEGATSVNNAVNSGVITVVFPATAPTNITSVNININAPVKGATPNTIASGSGDFDNDYNIGTVSWLPNDSKFLGGRSYTATVTLTAKSGYTFIGINSAYVKINGNNATVSNNTGSAVTLSYRFPETDARTVTNIAIKTQPSNLNYTHGDKLNLTGLVVTLTHDDTSTEDVTAADFTAKNITANPANGSELSCLTNNGQSIKITYGNFTPLFTNNLTVNPKIITFTVDAIPAQTYTGSPLQPPVTVKDGTTVLALTTDYTVAYSNNTNAGTAIATITGVGNYAGSSGSKNFTINAIQVILNSVTANGSTTQTTTQLTLTFDKSISGLTADDITLNGVSNVSKGTLSGSNPYTLPISGFTAGGTLSVSVSKSGYNISGSPKEVTISTAVTLNSVTANGSATQTTTQLTLNFSQAISSLSANDITISGVSGVNKGTLSASGATYTLPISGFTAGGTLNVSVSKSGYDISGSPKEVTIYYATAVTLNSVTANGSDTQTTTQLTLTFSQAISGLSAGDITLTGISNITKGTLSASGATYTLLISGFTYSGTLSVAVAKSGYDISGSSKTVYIYYMIPVTLNSITADGSSTQMTKQLTLTFNKAISGLTASDITLSGVSSVSKGTLSGSNPYTLTIYGFTSDGTLNVAVSKSGYVISGSPETVVIYYYLIPVTLNSVTANGSASQTTTQLTLTFDKAITWLSESNIILSGVSVSKGTLSGSNPYTLSVSVFTSGTMRVVVAQSGYAINNSPKTVTVYCHSYLPVIDMVSISAGTFIMGSPSNEPNRNSNETQHTVTLSSFKIGKYEVTQEQYQAVMGSNPSSFTSAVTGESGTPGKLPVEQVSWYDALVFCNKLSMAEGLSPAYRISGSTDPAAWGTVPTSSDSKWDAVEIVAGSTGYRLPTEAQWEYACRAGTTTAYNTGATISDSTGWYDSNSNSKTHQVGLKSANAWGLYDMHGNVSEWCWDRWGTYASGAQTDPTGAVTGTDNRVRRDGDWSYGGEYLRSAFRGYINPYYVLTYSKGFRLVRP